MLIIARASRRACARTQNEFVASINMKRSVEGSVWGEGLLIFKQIIELNVAV